MSRPNLSPVTCGAGGCQKPATHLISVPSEVQARRQAKRESMRAEQNASLAARGEQEISQEDWDSFMPDNADVHKAMAGVKEPVCGLHGSYACDKAKHKGLETPQLEEMTPAHHTFFKGLRKGMDLDYKKAASPEVLNDRGTYGDTIGTEQPRSGRPSNDVFDRLATPNTQGGITQPASVRRAVAGAVTGDAPLPEGQPGPEIRVGRGNSPMTAARPGRAGFSRRTGAFFTAASGGMPIYGDAEDVPAHVQANIDRVNDERRTLPFANQPELLAHLARQSAILGTERRYGDVFNKQGKLRDQKEDIPNLDEAENGNSQNDHPEMDEKALQDHWENILSETDKEVDSNSDDEHVDNSEGLGFNSVGMNKLEPAQLGKFHPLIDKGGSEMNYRTFGRAQGPGLAPGKRTDRTLEELKSAIPDTFEPTDSDGNPRTPPPVVTEITGRGQGPARRSVVHPWGATLKGPFARSGMPRQVAIAGEVTTSQVQPAKAAEPEVEETKPETKAFKTGHGATMKALSEVAGVPHKHAVAYLKTAADLKWMAPEKASDFLRNEYATNPAAWEKRMADIQAHSQRLSRKPKPLTPSQDSE